MYVMHNKGVVLRCIDYRGRIVVFEKVNYDKHKRKHPELEDNIYFPDRVINALQHPTYTIPGYKNNATCYYFEEYAINGIIKYTKVVVHEQSRLVNDEEVVCIKTTHKADHIQEIKYEDCELTNHQGKDNE